MCLHYNIKFSNLNLKAKKLWVVVRLKYYNDNICLDFSRFVYPNELIGMKEERNEKDQAYNVITVRILYFADACI